MNSSEPDAKVKKIIEVLSRFPIGETIPQKAVTEALGTSIHFCRHLVYRAMEAMNKDSGAAFATVYRVGWRRMHPSEVASVGRTARGRIRRMAARATSTMTSVMEKANDLDDRQIDNISREIGALAMLRHLARQRVVDKLPVIPVRSDGTIPQESVRAIFEGLR